MILAKKRHRSSPQNLCHVLVVGGDEGLPGSNCIAPVR